MNDIAISLDTVWMLLAHTELLVRKPDVPASKASFIDLSRLLFREEGASCWVGGPLHELPAVRDQEIIKAAQPAMRFL